MSSSFTISSRAQHDRYHHRKAHGASDFPRRYEWLAKAPDRGAIAMVMPVDTSEGERVFSLMNNIKTSERSRLNDENVRNLML
eukprot:scaffold203379_cov27-Tisochrysis_lutea.AAC.1